MRRRRWRTSLIQYFGRSSFSAKFFSMDCLIVSNFFSDVAPLKTRRVVSFCLLPKRMSVSSRSPIITVRFGLTSGKAKRIESNIGARGLPKIVGERPDAATIEAKIVPSPGSTAMSVCGVVTSSFVARNKTFGRLKYVAALTIFR